MGILLEKIPTNSNEFKFLVNIPPTFNVLLTVHHAMILGTCPTWRTNSFQCIYLFIVLYILRGCHAHHQEKQIVSIQLLVIVTLCWWQCRVLIGSKLPTSTRHCHSIWTITKNISKNNFVWGRKLGLHNFDCIYLVNNTEEKDNSEYLNFFLKRVLNHDGCIQSGVRTYEGFQLGNKSFQTLSKLLDLESCQPYVRWSTHHSKGLKITSVERIEKRSSIQQNYTPQPQKGI